MGWFRNLLESLGMLEDEDYAPDEEDDGEFPWQNNRGGW